MRRDVTFMSGGERCAAWHYAGEGDAFAGPGGRPCVVMAHGFGNTRDSGLEPFAERFAAEGLDVLLFDYRTFGASEGRPRRQVDWRAHRDDFRAALGCARGLPSVDPGRVVLWGTSYAGGHVVAVGADDGRVAAVIAQTPALDGRAALLALARSADPAMLVRATGLALRDAARGLAGREPLRVPVAGEPGTLAAIATPGALAGAERIAGPTFVNDFCARGMLGAAQNRPIGRADALRCPLLLQIAERDEVVPAGPIERAAERARGPVELRRYPCGHFDVYVGEHFERAVADQVAFLRRRLDARSGPDRTAGPLPGRRAA